MLFLVCMNLSAQKQDIGKLDKKMEITQADEDGIVWFDVKLQPFRIEGFAWFHEDQVFRRLPKSPSHPIREHVDNLANHSSGGQVHFRTNSKKVLIRAELINKSEMYHMPSTGQSGFDIYIGEPGNRTYRKTSRCNLDQTQFTSELFNGSEKLRNFVINFPLYNEVKSLEIGIKADSQVLPSLARKNKGKIVVYGTSITQGGCASRPGLAYTNILSRRLDYEFINLGFSGNGRGEPELAKLINQIEDKKMVILDYQANANESIKKSLEIFINIIRNKNPDLPILVVSKILYAKEIHQEKHMQKLNALTDFQEQLILRKKQQGDKNIHFVNGKSLLGKYAHEANVDGVHPNSYGFMMMAENLQPSIENILKNQSKSSGIK
ncbi:MAG: SGNH/GDSL hydrolase family protein [Lentisphaeraceae bacterium]|nr:SGNH/GDSL hydrolase family protein [Lentisphaeraceae bacterium]